ncbi:hypothetical protein SISNIDRAFT_225745 [Sistotremastrum niveocremeum HHB9708]|uniref:Uncharacterized protein n=1 Tax=Sistotremastrum niveocremeum HHB9708 TaxID=1314777 RepID=A0A164QA68_9AGAM|nr:hypothetical protein SISNIDRAFT_225745 [Sistotremastrum niveocremeum HHB9708]
MPDKLVQAENQDTDPIDPKPQARKTIPNLGSAFLSCPDGILLQNYDYQRPGNQTIKRRDERCSRRNHSVCQDKIGSSIPAVPFHTLRLGELVQAPLDDDGTPHIQEYTLHPDDEMKG